MPTATCSAPPPHLASSEKQPHSTHAGHRWRYGMQTVSENFSLIVMCICMLASLAFLAQQILSYH
jgi:hypothetical protein